MPVRRHGQQCSISYRTQNTKYKKTCQSLNLAATKLTREKTHICNNVLINVCVCVKLSV